MVKLARLVSKPQVLKAVSLLLSGALLAAVASVTPAAAQSGRTGSEVREGIVLEKIEVDQSSLILLTNVSPSYSSYSPQPNVYVVDLPQASKGGDVVIPAGLPPQVASVTADEAMELGSAMTRITIRLKEPVRPETVAVDRGIAIRFGSAPAPTAPDAQAVATSREESVPRVAVKPAETKVATAPPEKVAPAPVDLKGVQPATALQQLTQNSSNSGVAVDLGANGKVDYVTFRLDNPLRLVFDLNGVRNDLKTPQLDLDSAVVKRVRVAQFQSSPRPITRVVFDLSEPIDHQVVAGPKGLQVVFGAGAVEASPNLTAETAAPEAVAAAAPVTTASANTPAPAAKPAPSVFDEPPAVPVIAEYVAPSPVVARSDERHVVRAAGETTEPETKPASAPEMSGGKMRGESKTLSAGERVYTGEPIDLSLKDADIKDVLRTFAQLTGLNIAVDPQVAGTVTVEFVGVPWDQALEIILRQNGLTYVLQGNVMRVGTIDRLAQEQVQTQKLQTEAKLNVPTVTIIKDLSYAKADQVSSLLQQMASPKGKIIVDSRTNQLIITEVPEYLQTMLNLIETVDIATPQVVIEARIVETTKNFLQQFGVDWGFNAVIDPALGTGTGLMFPNSGTVAGGPFNFGKGSSLIDLALTDVVGAFDLDIALSAAENEGLARIVSAPKIVTQNNQAAEIQSGVQIPVQTRVNFTTTVQYIDATLRLSVTPQITARDTVIMDIQVQKTEPATGLSVAGANNVPLLTRRAQTRLMVRDGGTTVIGGIYQATENRSQDRVPLVHKIPVLGWLFKNYSVDSRHDELLIFITPKIMRNS